ncbi:hypothetical protein TWF696_000253 [Orbilia brochopaga]|uniref:Uncharacterized protein n=1 Tax=Orbilia brochopaga TaxID=3140254 RepID=A0AAV9VAR1_9PEZI
MQSLVRLLPLVAAANALVPAPRPALQASEPVLEPRLLGTSAEMLAVNQWPKKLGVVTSDAKYLNTSPPKSFSVAANSVSPRYPVEAEGMIPLQSSFKVCCLPENEKQSCVSIDLGVAPWKTDYTPASDNPSTQMGVMLAPAKILEAGRDFDIHILCGQGAFTSFANSIIASKLDGFVNGIKQKPVVVKASDDITVTIRDIVKPSVAATYVSLNTLPSGQNKIDGIVKLSGTVKGSIKFKDTTQDFSISVGGAQLLLSAEGTLFAAAKSAQLNLDVKQLQVSVNDIDISGDILVDIVGVLYPILAPVIKLPYKLASIVNTSENVKVLALANKAIKALANGGL